jgi:hypothetical protein
VAQARRRVPARGRIVVNKVATIACQPSGSAFGLIRQAQTSASAKRRAGVTVRDWQDWQSTLKKRPDQRNEAGERQDYPVKFVSVQKGPAQKPDALQAIVIGDGRSFQLERFQRDLLGQHDVTAGRASCPVQRPSLA